MSRELKISIPSEMYDFIKDKLFLLANKRDQELWEVFYDGVRLLAANIKQDKKERVRYQHVCKKCGMLFWNNHWSSGCKNKDCRAIPFYVVSKPAREKPVGMEA